MTEESTWPTPQPAGPEAPSHVDEHVERPWWTWASFALAIAIGVPILLYVAARSLFGAVGCSLEGGDCDTAGWVAFIALGVATIAVPAAALAMTAVTRSWPHRVGWCIVMFVPAVVWSAVFL